MKELHILISGTVQGVGFRWFVQREAEAASISGSVRNLPSGEVEIYARGEEENMERFLKILRRGPSYARVEQVRVEPAGKSIPDKEGFRIAF